MSGSWKRSEHFIDGDWYTPAAGELLAIENPATGESIGTAARGGREEVDLAVEAATRAWPGWSATSPAERAEALGALRDALGARKKELVDLTVAELGVPVTFAGDVHVPLALGDLDAFARDVRDFPFEERIGNSLVLKESAGVAGCVTPWNYPLHQMAAKVGAALAAGCTVVLKPAELTPLAAYALAEAACDAGLPPGVFNVVFGSGRVVGDALTRNPGVDVVSFTGSTAVGTSVAEVAAGDVRRCLLELGGKSASVALPDADFEAATRWTVRSATVNSGQTCSACTRLIVPRSNYADVVAYAGELAAGLRVGDPLDATTDLGPVVSARQRETVLGFVERAVANGARVEPAGTGDLPDRGHYVRPAVVSGTHPFSEIAQEEVFGPVLVVLAYDDEDEAAAIANSTRYGLSGAVWSADAGRATTFARRLRTGQVDVNGGQWNFSAPFGGYKQSGTGRELGPHGIADFCEVKSIQL